MENREEMTGITVKTNVIKRNGQEVAFDISKIVNAIRKANKEVEGIHQMSGFFLQCRLCSYCSHHELLRGCLRKAEG